MGLKDFAIISDGSKIKNPKFFKKSQNKLAKAQQKLEKQIKGSKKRKKCKKIVSKIHEKIKNKRDNFCHQESIKLVKKYDIICIEDLNVKSMLEEKKFSKSISDVAWNGFIEKLIYKAENAGKLVIKINPKNTTKTCSGCGNIQEMPLENRIYKCSKCGLEIDRDINASLNIKRLGLQSLVRNNNLEAQVNFCLGVVTIERVH
jgi:putative transposase